MRRAAQILAALLALTACSSAHVADDAGATDARVEMDARTPDARAPDAPPGMDRFVCPDLDGDGASDARCGGYDCDDADPSIDATRSVCVDTTTRRSCEGRLVEEAPCPPEASLCDARTGACATSACGDGVIHEGEVCDDGNVEVGDGCDAACLFERCLRSSDCPAYAPSCSDRRDGAVYCRALDAGLPNGANCLVDAECASGWCDDEQQKCTAACSGHDDCGHAVGFCWEARCRYGCTSASDCSPERRCVLWPTDALRTMCDVERGTDALGEPCDSRLECDSAVCAYSYGGCSTLCSEDADCAGHPAGETCFFYLPMWAPGWPELGVCSTYPVMSR